MNHQIAKDSGRVSSGQPCPAATLVQQLRCRKSHRLRLKTALPPPPELNIGTFKACASNRITSRAIIRLFSLLAGLASYGVAGHALRCRKSASRALTPPSVLKGSSTLQTSSADASEMRLWVSLQVKAPPLLQSKKQLPCFLPSLLRTLVDSVPICHP
eukprot:2689134-Amphidinium_carterae.3